MDIAIIGCGWLGKPLAKHLSTHHKLTCFSRTYTPDSFWQNQLFIICISTKDDYLQSLRKFCEKIPPSSQLIFTSSTSVYKEFDEEVNEETILHQTSVQKQAEELILASHPKALILRLGGLMGDDRVSGKWKNISSFSDSYVNYIHLDDLLNIIHTLISKEIFTGIFNLVAPMHPLRSLVHKQNSQDFGFTLASFKGMNNKVVSSKKIIQTLKYTFLHPNPLLFWRKH